jgi:fatty acyl-CoA reductase
MTTPSQWSALSGAHILLTGATGFVGQAVLERLLSAHPDARICLVIRPKRNLSAEDRLGRLLRKPAFRAWRRSTGAAEADRLVRERITVIPGDLATLPPLPADVHTVIHNASTVKFDPAIDEAFDANVGGAVGLYQALHAAGATPHVVHVSTAYVGGLRKGIRPEVSLSHEVDWRSEMEAARTARHSTELASREPDVLRRVIARARAEHGKAGPQAVTRAAELARQEWVTERLVDQGRLRAQSLGWTDVYTFTKALAERAAEDLWSREGQRLSVIRPTIIESALAHPYPGWIDGFKVADPLILAYGRGQLPDFPALPDSVLDIIPVDYVVNAILAAAATPPVPPEHRRYFHIGSGASNPLAFHKMYENVREFFVRSPLPADHGEVQVPRWRLDGDRRVTRAMRQREALVTGAGWVLTRLPMTARSRSLADRVHKLQQDLSALRKLTDLYRPYVQTEMVFDDYRARELHLAVPAADRADRGFDVTRIDWRSYLQGVHFPAIVELSRARTARSHSPAPQSVPMLPVRRDVLAVFDLEGTVLGWNLIEQYLWLARALTPVARWPAELGSLAVSLPDYLRSELRDRGEFIRTFTRRYAGLPADQIRREVQGGFGRALRLRVLPDAVARVRAHRAAGHHTVLVTGAIDMLVEPLAPLFHEVVAGRMHELDGVLTGYLDAPPLVDEARGAWLTRYAEKHGMDLRHSYGYGDSHADVAWLQLLGRPAAVNPDSKLYRHARRNSWAVFQWGHTATAKPPPPARERTAAPTGETALERPARQMKR